MTDLFTVYTYGAGEVVDNIFNAIAIIYTDGYMQKFFNFSVMIGLIWAGAKAGVTREHSKHYVRWFYGYIIAILILLQPVSMFGHKGMTMHWRDVVTGQSGKVDHLPPGLVVPAGVISGLGFEVTKLFETLFASPASMAGYLPYHQYGTTFAAQVRSDLRDVRIQNPILRENLESYITKCMMYDTLQGGIYDIQGLMNTDNIWEFLKEYSSNLRMFNYRKERKSDDDPGGREWVKCRTGLGMLEQSFNAEENLVAKKFSGFTNLMNARQVNSQNAKNGFMKALELSSKFYGDLNVNASAQLRQVLIINQFKRVPHSYGTVKAMQHQNTTWKMVGDLGQFSLPILHSIFQALIYASFPIVVTLLFFSQRYQTLRTYFEMMVWIELWPLLFAVLNGAVSIFAKRAGIDHEITINSINNIVSTQSKYAMMAYGMGISIPAFAYMIAKGGVGQFVHMAGGLMAATQRGADVAANELTTGNRSLDNVSVGNKSFNNVSGNKHDTSGSFGVGYVSARLADGTLRTQNMYSDTHGGQIFKAGAGITRSTGSAAFSAAQSSLSQQENRLSEMDSKVAGERNAVNESFSEVHSAATSYMARNYDNIVENNGYNIGRDGKEGSSLSKIANDTKTLVEDYGYTKEQAAATALNAALKGEASSPKVGKGGLSGGGSLGVSGDARVSDSDKQQLSEGARIDTGTQSQQIFGDILTYSKKDSLTEGKGSETAEAQNFNNSYDQLKQKQKNLEYSENQMKQLEQSVRMSKSFSFMKNEDKFQDFLTFFADHGDYTTEHPGKKFGYQNAMSHIERRDEIYDEISKQYLGKTHHPDFAINRFDPEIKARFNKNNAFSQNVKEKVDSTEIKNNTENVKTPNTMATTSSKPKDSGDLNTDAANTSQGGSIKNKVDNLFKANEQEMQNQLMKTHKNKTALEKKIDEADNEGLLRKTGFIGRKNKFTSKRKEDSKNE